MLEAVAWAWDKDLPPEQKLALLYLANRPEGQAQYDPVKLARFVGIPVHGVEKLLWAMHRDGLIWARTSTQEAVLAR